MSNNVSSKHLDSTSAHPPPHHRNATSAEDAGLTASNSSSPAELASLKMTLSSSLRQIQQLAQAKKGLVKPNISNQFSDFPSPGILFEDILPIFANPILHENLITALALHIQQSFSPGQRPDIIVGLEARGFLFGPSLALKLGAGFVPVRKPGKLPGPTEEAGFKKEYGTDFFQIQADGIKQGQQVLVVDDIIATGGSAAAAGSLVKKLGGVLLGYVFILELDFLKGRAKLDAPAYTLLSSQETGPAKS